MFTQILFELVNLKLLLSRYQVYWIQIFKGILKSMIGSSHCRKLLLEISIDLSREGEKWLVVEASLKGLLDSKELGTNVLELYFVMLANYDQNVFSLV